MNPETYTILIKNDSETTPNCGCIPEKRSLNEYIKKGIVNINKPKGPTSHEVSEYVKLILDAQKAGQSGTLDPGVTGVLPVGIDKATRVLHELLVCGKEYVCVMHLHDLYTAEKIREVCASFVGKIRQFPPLKSAVKRQWRTREIYYLDILEIDNQDVLFRVGCEAGTYIRRLVDDIGKKLGRGAHMAQLIRTKVGFFTDENMVTLQDLKDAFEEKNEVLLRKFIFPMEKAVSHMKKIWIHDQTIVSVCNGRSIAIPGIAKLHDCIGIDDAVAIFSQKNELVGIGRALLDSSLIMQAQKGLAFSVEKVFMEPSIYEKSFN